MERSGWVILLVLVCLLAPATYARQDNGDSEDTTDGAQPDQEAPITDQPGGIDAANERARDNEEDEEGDGDADGEEEGRGRFIPSEQISQDLGVSFPADI